MADQRLHQLGDTENGDRRPFELPGAKPHYTPDRPGQVNHIALDLSLDLVNRRFQGTCTITLTPVRRGIQQLVLDAVGLQIESVLVNSVSQPFEYNGEQLTVRLLEPTGTESLEIAIAYNAENPQRGLYFVGPEDFYPDKPVQVWTQGEDEDSRFWFPCFDYPGQLATSEIRVRVPQPFIAIANGELLATETVDNQTIYHWLQRQVHPTYLMTLAVGNFAELSDSWQGIPVNYYVEKGREADGWRSMSKTPQMIAFFSEKYGYPYPYPKYAQVCVADFIFGGMENTSTTLLTDRCLLDERATIDDQRTESLVAHELAHQWFGDLVVIKHWSHAWIKEGMASYAEVLWTEQEYGKDDAAYYLLGEARNYLEEDSSRYRRPIVTHIYREAIELYDRHLYEKGACVYHMIRSILGEELWDLAIQSFVQDNAHRTVETVDLLRVIEQVTGYNLAFLFDQYVFRGGHPEYQVTYSWDSENNLAKLTVLQAQVKQDKNGSDSQLFDLKIPIVFGYIQEPANLKQFILRLYEKEQSFYFPLANKPDFVSFDVGNYFLKTVNLEYPIPELKAQLKHDSDPISRIYAATALAKKGGLESVIALTETLLQDPFWGVRVEAAKQLGNIKLNQAGTALIQGLQDENARVRRAAAEALSEIKNAECYEALKIALEIGDVSYYVEAAIARSLVAILGGNLKEKTTEVIELLKRVLVERAGWNEVVRSGAIGGLSQMKTVPIAAEIIQEYTKLGIPQPLRLAAIRALGEVSCGQSVDKVEAIIEQLTVISQENFFLTQVAVVTALSKMETPKAIPLLQSLAQRTPDGRVRRLAEEAVAKVEKKLAPDKVIQELRDQLEKLKQENQEINSRLTKLETEKTA